MWRKFLFSNQYKMKVAGNLFLPKNMKEGDKYPAIIVRTSNGSCQGTERESLRNENGRTGFCNTLHRPVFWGGSEGEPRNAVLPEVYAEDFSATVDF